MRKERRLWAALLLSAMICTACAPRVTDIPIEKTEAYQMITAQQAKEAMDTESVIILDVRTQEEYLQGHIPNAILIPDSDIQAQAPTALPDQSATVLVYCRSGRRSKLASEKLAAMGYTNVRDFGGIIDWPYDIVTDSKP